MSFSIIKVRVADGVLVVMATGQGVALWWISKQVRWMRVGDIIRETVMLQHTNPLSLVTIIRPYVVHSKYPTMQRGGSVTTTERFTITHCTDGLFLTDVRGPRKVLSRCLLITKTSQDEQPVQHRFMWAHADVRYFCDLFHQNDIMYWS